MWEFYDWILNKMVKRRKAYSISCYCKRREKHKYGRDGYQCVCRLDKKAEQEKTDEIIKVDKVSMN